MDHLRIEHHGGIARLILARPEKHNAFDDFLIAALTRAIRDLEDDGQIRAIVLAADGRSFSAGADLDWMKAAGEKTHADNLADARALAKLMQTLASCTKPTIAQIQGAAFGGGVGLIACCDIAIASTNAKFALSEVKLGLIPAAISPYVIAAIGARQARRYFQTGEAFDASTATRIGLVHEVVAPEALASRVNDIMTAIVKAAPGAVQAAKKLVGDVAGKPIDEHIIEMTAAHIADIRSGPEAREGLAAFLQQRPPRWTMTEDEDGQ